MSFSLGHSRRASVGESSCFDSCRIDDHSRTFTDSPIWNSVATVFERQWQWGFIVMRYGMYKLRLYESEWYSKACPLNIWLLCNTVQHSITSMDCPQISTDQLEVPLRSRSGEYRQVRVTVFTQLCATTSKEGLSGQPQRLSSAGEKLRVWVKHGTHPCQRPMAKMTRLKAAPIGMRQVQLFNILHHLRHPLLSVAFRFQEVVKLPF